MAKNTGALRHVHRYYKKYNNKGKPRWHCMRDGCTHFLSGDDPVGLNTICWDCEKTFMLTYAHMYQDKPRCDECIEQAEMVEEVLKDKIPEYKPEGIDAFKSSTQRLMERAEKNRLERERALAAEPDEVEVIEPDEDN